MIDFINGFLICGLVSWSMGVQLYDPMSEMCCQGAVHSLTLPQADLAPPHVFCCGTAAYDLRRSICCGTRVLPRNHSDVSCCGAAAYDASTSLCCSGTVVPIGDDQDGGSGDVEDDITEDENSTLLDPGEEFIPVDIDVTPGDSNTTTDVTTTFGFYHVSMLCCGQEAYDWRRQMCCAAGVRQRPYRRAECCGAAAYDVSRQVCCGTAVHDDGAAGLFCCSQLAYDSNVQQCCDGELLSKPNASATYTCCGNQLMDAATQGCCGTAVINTTAQLCCDGVVRDIVAGAALRCCGTVTCGELDACCDGTVHENKRSVPCCGTGLLVDDKRDMCCEGNVVQRRTTATQCCGGAAYESDRQLCCQSRVLSRGSASEDCCGDRVYDADTQVCCFEGAYHVLDKNGSRATCCSRSPDPN